MSDCQDIVCEKREYPKGFYSSICAEKRSIEKLKNTRENRENKYYFLFLEEFRFAYMNAVRALKKIGRVKTQSGIPCMYLIVEKLFEKEHEISASGFRRHLAECSVFYDFETTELLALRDYIILYIARAMIDSGMSIESCAGMFLGLKNIDFSSLYYDFAKVHEIFSEEKAGVYKNCSKDTKFSYDEILKNKYTDEITAAKRILNAANEAGVHVGHYLLNTDRHIAKYYFWLLGVITLCFFLITFLISNVFTAIIALVPSYMLAKELTKPLFKYEKRIVPKINEGEELDKAKCVIAITTLLRGEKYDCAVFDNLESFYLSNKRENNHFVVLGDLGEYNKKRSPEDNGIIKYAISRVDLLNRKYGNRFSLFIRPRRFAVCERVYFGWERKRGAVIELCRYIKGKGGTFETAHNGKAVVGFEYLLTLDSDTMLQPGSVKELLGIAVHSQNKPVFDSDGKNIVSGYGIIQPQMAVSLEASHKTRFCEITSGVSGIDRYSFDSFDFMRDVLEMGNFCGKGLINVDAFSRVCDGYFPKERILSHDFLEGALIKTLNVGGVVLTDGTPKNALSYYMRKGRWIRGDLQALPYALGYTTNEKGEKIKNKIPIISRYQIVDNVISESSAFFVLLLLLSAIWGGYATAAFSASYIVVPILREFKLLLLSVPRSLRKRQLLGLGKTALTVIYNLSSMVVDSFVFLKSLVSVCRSTFISKEGFLSWTTAAEADNIHRRGIAFYGGCMLPSLIIGAAASVISADTLALGIIWTLFPFAVHWSGNPYKCKKIPENYVKKTTRYAAEMWRFFDKNVNDSTNWLPPDNIQTSPTEVVAMRTSPTNIGLYLLSIVAARDFGFIDSDELFERSSKAFFAIDKMNLWNGHLYNWYDIETLNVIGNPFVSTVDSGNFVSSLVAYCEGIKEYIADCPRISNVLISAEEYIRSADFSKLFNEERGYLSIGYDIERGRLVDSCYDQLMSESRTTTYFAEATNQIPCGTYRLLKRQDMGLYDFCSGAWSGTVFEYFMPSIFLPQIPRSIVDGTLKSVFKEAKRNSVYLRGVNEKIFGISESCFFEFDAHMNYQYRAFGSYRLALDHFAACEKIISPYSSFLMIGMDYQSVISNLDKFEAIGARGEYGFYESVDAEEKRVGGGFALIKCFMSHHIGMSFLSLSNFLLDNIVSERFMRNPNMRAYTELLDERIPVGSVSYNKNRVLSNERAEIPRRMLDYHAEKDSNPSLICPRVCMISNNKLRALASSSGQIAVNDGKIMCINSSLDNFSLGGGLRFICIADGSAFYAQPLGQVSEEFNSSFYFDFDGINIVYSSEHVKDNLSVGFDVKLCLDEENDVFNAEMSFDGECENLLFAVYFEPIIDEAEAYISHKSFSNLFVESDFLQDEKILVFKRRPRIEKKPFQYLGIYSDSNINRNSFDTVREDFLPLNYGDIDIVDAARKIGSGKVGATVVPACLLRLKPEQNKKCVKLRMGFSRNIDDLVYFLSSEDSSNCKRIYEIQKAVCAANHLTLHLEEDILKNTFLNRFVRFGKSSSVASALSKKPLGQDIYWKFGISGDIDTVCVNVSFGEKQISELSEILRAFKFSAIRGFRFDLIILFSESDKYNCSTRRGIECAIEGMGLGSFLGCRGGVFVIDKDLCSESEIFILSGCAVAVYELSNGIASCLSEKGVTNVSASVSKLLKKRPMALINDIPPESQTNVIRVKGGYFGNDFFVIEKERAAPPWSHIIACETFGTVVSENSLGFTFYKNAALGKLTVHNADNMVEDSGERLILRVYLNAEITNFKDFDIIAGSKYVKIGWGYAEYFGSVLGVRYSVKVSICEKMNAKRISVHFYDGFKPYKKIMLIYAVVPCLGERREERTTLFFENYENGSVTFSKIMRRENVITSGIVCTSCNEFELFVDEISLKTGGAFSGSGGDIAAVGAKMHGSEIKNVQFFLAALSHDTDENDLIENLCFENDSPHDIGVAVNPILKTENPLIDSAVNFWFPYQTIFSRLYARSGFYQIGGAYGFRDQLQDVISLIPYAPSVAKAQIILASSRQYEDGSVMHWWHELEKPKGIRSRCSDDSAWLAYVLYEYVMKTGDVDILQCETPYLHSPPLSDHEHERYETAQESDLKEPILLHAFRGIERTFRTGSHGLCLMGSGDWNDGMNLVGKKGRGESVWLAFFSAVTAKRLAKLFVIAKDGEKASFLEKNAEKLLDAAEMAYDNKWFLRGYYDDGTPLGSGTNDECQIDVMPQAFSAIAAAEVCSDLKEKAREALESSYSLLFDRGHGIFRLLYPPFDKSNQSPGYIKGYVPGIRENGGQYSHAAVFAALGMLKIGMNREGAEIMMAICPALKDGREYRIEPYVLAGDVYSNPTCIGRGGWSWYTGAAGWYRTVFIEELCGFKLYPWGFKIEPRLSDVFSSFSMTVNCHQTSYKIKVSLSEREFVVLDGREWKNEFLFDGASHEVEIFSTGNSGKLIPHFSDVIDIFAKP